MSQHSVSSDDMFNDNLTESPAWGPDNHYDHIPSKDSIYGNIYENPDTGKEYRVTETDIFGHPTKVEETWP